MNAPRTGFVTQLGMDHLKAVEAAASYDFDFVELMMDGRGARRNLVNRVDDLAAALDAADLGLLVHLPFGGIDLGSPFEHVREGAVRETRAHLDLAADLGAEKAIVHPDSAAWSPAWDASTLREAAAASLRDLDAHADDRGVELCAENVPRSTVRTHDFPELLRETDVSMTLDTGHARMDGRDSGGIAAFVDRFGERISHFHLNDTRQPSDEHLPFGAGDIDFDVIFDALSDGWDGTLSLEVYTHDFGYIETSKERLDALLANRANRGERAT